MVMAIIVAEQPEVVEVYTTETVRAVKSCLEKTGLTLADEKQEAILIINRRKKHRESGSRWLYGRR